jgi:large subunit ribosomal protein L10
MLSVTETMGRINEGRQNMPRPEKVQRVEEITENFKSARNIFIADYSGLNVNDITDLRKQLRENGVAFRVEKNTLLRRAMSKLGWEELLPDLKGPTAVAVSAEDPNVPAKILYDFYDRLEKPKVRVFRVDERLYQGDDLKPLAKLPPRDVLLSELIAAVESPIATLIGTLDGVMRDFVGTLEALAKKKEEGGE